MKIYVCVKQVPDTSGKVAVNPDGTLNRASMQTITNPDDMNAVEAALKLKDELGCKVTVVTMGPPPAEGMLRELMAMGADDGYLVSAREFGGSDTYATSQILAAALDTIGLDDDDIVFCGRQAIDGDTAQVGPQIAEKLGLELQIDDMDFDAALLSVQQGKADIAMAGVTVTDERKAVMDFSDSYATGIQSIIVPNDSDIASPDDLAGKTIGTQRGTTGYIYCSDDFGDENVVAYDDGLTAVQALNNGQVDAVVIDNAPAQEFVAANPGLKILDTSYAEEEYAIGMAKGSSLEAAVNAALEELKADGTLQAIVDKYITAE